MIPKNTILGTLSIDEIFEEYDGPQLFSCVNEYRVLFLALHAPRTSAGDNWIFLPLSRRRLNDLKQSKRTLANAFFNPEHGIIDLITYDEVGKVNIKRVTPKDLPRNFLPDDEVMLVDSDAIDGASDIVLVDASPPGQLRVGVPAIRGVPEFLRTPAPMWEVSPRAVQYLRAIRTPVDVAARLSRRAVLDLTFRKGESRIDFPLASLGSVLMSMQRLVDSLSASLSGKEIASARSWMQLDAVAIFPGSFGLRIESHTGTLAQLDGMRSAFETLASLIAAGADRRLIRDLFVVAGSQSALSYRTFVKSLHNSEADFALEMALPDDAGPRAVTMRSAEAAQLVRILEAEDLSSTNIIEIRGRLVAVNLKTKYFMLQSGEDLIAGRISDACMPMMIGKQVDSPYAARVERRLELSDVTGQEVEKYKLLQIS